VRHREMQDLVAAVEAAPSGPGQSVARNGGSARSDRDLEAAARCRWPLPSQTV
jgi:hypothetical protein